MFGSNILDVAIGIIFVFILVSTICSAVREGIEAWLKTRAAYLEQGIRQLFTSAHGDDPAGDATAFVKKLYNSPAIFGLFNGSYTPGTNNASPDIMAKGGNLPSYIPSKNFAVALLDIAVKGPQGDQQTTEHGAPVVSLDSLRANVKLIDNPVAQQVVLNAINYAQGDLNKAQASIETWYNSSMDRVSGWYKRSTQWIILWVALAVTILLNINSISIINYLSKNDAARKAIVERAGAIKKDSIAEHLNYDEVKKDLQDMDFPMGWPKGLSSFALDPGKTTGGFWNWGLGPILGWLITAFAATLGAPFWFDILNKVMVIRSTVKPHEKSGEEASQDAQSPAQKVVYVAAPAQAVAAAAPGAAITTPGTGTNTDEPDGCVGIVSQLTGDDELPASKGGMV